MTVATFTLALGTVLAVVACHTATARASSTASPVRPVQVRPPVRSGFLDIRCVPETVDGTCPVAQQHWHLGADVVVNRDTCSSLAPLGGCRRVYAMRAGVVFLRYGRAKTYCGVVRAGTVGYGHVMPRVHLGEQVAVGQFIGWSCKSQEHVHIGNFVHGPCYTPGLGSPTWPACRYRDPLAPGGTLYDQSDTVGPTITPVIEDGYVDANIQDARAPGWLVGIYAHLYNNLPPARVVVDGNTLVDAAWSWDGQGPGGNGGLANGLPAVGTVNAPEYTRNARAGVCAVLPSTDACAGLYDFRLAPAVAGVPVVIQAWDSAGNESTVTVTP